MTSYCSPTSVRYYSTYRRPSQTLCRVCRVCRVSREWPQWSKRRVEPLGLWPKEFNAPTRLGECEGHAVRPLYGSFASKVVYYNYKHSSITISPVVPKLSYFLHTHRPGHIEIFSLALFDNVIIQFSFPFAYLHINPTGRPKSHVFTNLKPLPSVCEHFHRIRPTGTGITYQNVQSLHR